MLGKMIHILIAEITIVYWQGKLGKKYNDRWNTVVYW